MSDNLVLIIFGVYVLLCVSLLILTCIGFAKMFEKAGYEKWRAWVPFVSQITWCRMVLGKGRLAILLFLMFIPVITPVSLFFIFFLWYHTAKAFGSNAFVGFVAPEVPFIIAMMLGYGRYEYQGVQLQSKQ